MFSKSIGLRAEYEVTTDVGGENTTGGDSDIRNIGVAMTYRF